MGRKVNEECRERNMPCPSGLAGLDDDVYAHCLHTHPCVHSWISALQFPIYKQWGKYTETGVLGATGHFAGAHLLWAFGFWSWQRTGLDWRCLNLPLKYQGSLLLLQLLKFGNTCKCHCLSGRSFAFPIPWSGGCLSSVSSPQRNVSGKSTDLIFGFCLNKISTRHMPELPVKGKPRHGLGNRTNVCRGVH